MSLLGSVRESSSPFTGSSCYVAVLEQFLLGRSRDRLEREALLITKGQGYLIRQFIDDSDRRSDWVTIVQQRIARAEVKKSTSKFGDLLSNEFPFAILGGKR